MRDSISQHSTLTLLFKQKFHISKIKICHANEDDDIKLQAVDDCVGAYVRTRAPVGLRRDRLPPSVFVQKSHYNGSEHNYRHEKELT